jgi:tRNA (adenine37-N6)-methyltransferase
MDISFRPIGIIHSPFRDLSGMPIQPTGEASAAGTVEIFPEFEAGLKDLAGFSHIILLYYFHQVRDVKLIVLPFLDSEPHGIFATRAPARPNPIGMSIVRLLGIEGSTLRVENLDILDGTPLLDIKPYVPDFDYRAEARAGWLVKVQGKAREMKSDDRFRG